MSAEVPRPAEPGSSRDAELRASLRDLTSLLALPALWSGQSPQAIVESLAEALDAVVPVDLCYAWATLLAEQPSITVLRAAGRVQARDDPQWAWLSGLCRTLSQTDQAVRAEDTPLGPLQMLRIEMGYYGRNGFVCVGSRDPQFPSAAQRVALRAAVSLAAASLNSAILVQDREHANRAKDEFLAMLGHELRNPLAPIVTALNLMKLRGGEEFIHERLIIERQVAHLTRLIDDLLDISRVTRGKVELKKEPVEVGAFVAKAVETASPIFEQRRHHLRIDVAPGGLMAHGDRTRLAQVVSNLLINAAKYTEPGGEVSVRAYREGEQLCLAVTDNGIGIAPELLPRIFDLFTQGQTSMDRAHGGLGIGLALVKSLVALHGGTVSAHSEGPGKGSEFRVCLPAYRGKARPAADADQPPNRLDVGKGERILVVDDNRDAATALAELLRAVGYQVAVAHDPLEALAELERFAPATMIVDIGLPVMNGYELAARIRERNGSNAPRLLALTGYGLEADRARGRAAGFEAHLVKPVDLDALLDAVRR